MRLWRDRRLAGLGMVCTGVVCPCHVLVGAAAVITGGTILPPAAQDGLHAVYVPLAVLLGAALLRPRTAPRSTSPRGGAG